VCVLLIVLCACAVVGAAPAHATTVYAVPNDGTAPTVLGTAPGSYPSAACWNDDGSVTLQPEEQRAFVRFPGGTQSGPQRSADTALDTSVPARCGPSAEYNYGFDDRPCCRFGYLVRDASGRELFRSTGTEITEGDEAAIWSADASRLATVLWESPTRRSLRVYDIATGRRLLRRRFDADLAPHAFSPDGRFLAWTPEGDLLRPKPQRLALLDIAAGTTRRLGPTPASDLEDPAWSPDGTRIAVRSDTAMGNQLLVLDARTGAALFALPAPGVYEAPLAWSPDGTTIAVRTVGGNGGETLEGLALIRAVPGARLRAVLAQKVGAMSDPVWSPDGRVVAVARGDRPRLRRR
jgi:hypothetical protein